MNRSFSALFIDIDKILIPKGNKVEKMMSSLNYMSSVCIKSNTHGYKHPLSFFPADSRSQRALIIVLPMKAVQQYELSDDETVLEEFNNGSAFSISLGHCYITWDKTKDVCGLWDICLHEQFQNTPGAGYGTILLECILDSIMMHLPSHTTLWLGVDIRNPQFSKVISLYAKFGFTNPYISFTDPFDYNWREQLPFGFLSLSRVNDYIDPEDFNRQSIMNDVLYTVMQYTKVQKLRIPMDSTLAGVKGIKYEIDMNTENYCIIFAKFKNSYAKWLSKLPLSASTLNSNGSVTQKEVSGAFLLDKPQLQDNGTMLWEITVDKNRGIIATNEESVELKVGRYNFHTHPREAYSKYKVSVGYPSGADYYAFLYALFTHGTIFHCVISLEGIYTISCNPYWTIRLKKLRELGKKYPGGDKALHDYIYKYMELQKVIPVGMTPLEAIKDYTEQINKKVLFVNEEPVFNCSFLSWEEVMNGEAIVVAYPIFYNQCFATERSLASLYRLNKKEVLRVEN